MTMTRKILLLPLILFFFPVVSLGEKIDDLVLSGLHYKKFANAPQGAFRNGKKEGPWVSYHDNGQLFWKGTYKEGKEEGPWVSHHYNGQLFWKGTYKDGKVEGPWISYWDSVLVNSNRTLFLETVRS